MIQTDNLKARDMSSSDDERYAWVPACGGTETEFEYDGKTYLYMWNYVTKDHAYYCVTDDAFCDYPPISY